MSGDVAALGLPTLAAVLDGVEDGITVVDADGRFVHANPAACRMLGRPLDRLRGGELLGALGFGGGATPPGRFPWGPEDAPAPFRCLVGGPDTVGREVTCSVVATDIGGARHWVAILRDLGGGPARERTAVALAQTTAQLVAAGTVEEILRGIARHAVDSTAAVACGIVVIGDDHKLAVAGGYGFPDRARSMSAWTASSVTLDEMPGGSHVLTGKPVFLPDARAAMGAAPATRAFAATMESLDWQGSYYAPLSWEGEVFGVFGAHRPPGAADPNAEECAFYNVLADQCAVAVTNARLAASMERTRLARELHDSISQALFSMTMHARAAQLAMSKADLDDSGPLGRSVAQLAELTRGTLAEMRALIFELRPGALAEEGLVSALRKQGAALTAREQVAIAVDGPERRLDLGSGVEEHLYRIASEALNNVVKHAGARHATVHVTVEAGALRTVVSDDGAGFDPAAEHSGSMGLSSMAERAQAIGAQFTVTSTRHPGADGVTGVTHVTGVTGADAGRTGTVVTVTLPHRRRGHPKEGT
ncbi:histidine kinase [Streptacidiphilus sp. P02-A3a]|uniref:sensor histidine kinase n=1 Tax=Streptacidiphilus sp. P02-A3a TaxID=2704468 RepID=UPI0015FD9476|nr:histidine kinase [Streptacidiphilus sp. P02-A3a]QMU73411.1 GAF domain-containing protein [Streptacidiphilus sp. P02-A3a]